MAQRLCQHNPRCTQRQLPGCARPRYPPPASANVRFKEIDRLRLRGPIDCSDFAGKPVERRPEQIASAKSATGVAAGQAADREPRRPVRQDDRRGSSPDTPVCAQPRQSSLPEGALSIWREFQPSRPRWPASPGRQPALARAERAALFRLSVTELRIAFRPCRLSCSRPTRLTRATLRIG